MKSPLYKILFVSTNSLLKHVDLELSDVRSALQASKYHDLLEIQFLSSVPPEDFAQALLGIKPNIVHFAAQGDSEGIYFQDQNGQSHLATHDALSSLFKPKLGQIDVVVMNTRDSTEQANVILQFVPYVITMDKSISSPAANAFAMRFYQALGECKTISDAFEIGLRSISLKDSAEGRQAQLLSNPELKVRDACKDIEQSAEPREDENSASWHDGDNLNIDQNFSVTVGGEEGSAASSPMSFSAYPRIDAPISVKWEETIDIRVGFSIEASANTTALRPILVSDVKADEEIKVILDCEGGTVVGPDAKALRLEHYAEAHFQCTVQKGAENLKLEALYMRDNVMVGKGSRIIPIEGLVFNEAIQEFLPCTMKLENKDRADFMIILNKLDDERLRWSFVAEPLYPFTQVDFKPSASDSIGATKLLNDTLKSEAYTGINADSLIQNLGGKIRQLIPDQLLLALKSVYAEIKRPPILALYTNEIYIPWELALLPHTMVLDETAPPYLGAQVIMGRWYLGYRVPFPPPTEVSFNGFTVFSGAPDLPETIKESEYLESRFKASRLEAQRGKFTTMIQSEQYKRGKNILHFAVHGISSAKENNAVIVFYDETKEFRPYYVRPELLRLTYDCNADRSPNLYGVFLNACQTAVAGASLGQLAGFPGEFMSKGVSYFIAPLWEVRDKYARQFAEGFYELTLSQGKTVGEALFELRRRYIFNEDHADCYSNIEMLAYVYYGNPNLRLLPLSST